MELRHFYKKGIKSIKLNNNLKDFYTLIDSPFFKKPISISLDKIKTLFHNNIKTKNIKKTPYLPPDTAELDLPLTTTIDDNYLYIWHEKQQKWKRIPLSDWEF